MSHPVVLRIFKNNHMIMVKQFELKQIVIGSGDSVQLRLQDKYISEVHCMFENRDGEFYICDLGSSTGTFKNEKPLLDEKIESGEDVFVGEFKISFFWGAQITSEIRNDQIAVPSQKSDKLPIRPVIKDRKIVKNRKTETFAPPSEIKNIQEFLKPKKGPFVELIVTWKERILDTYHFRKKGKYRIGNKDENIRYGQEFFSKQWPLVNIENSTQIYFTSSMRIQIVNSEKKYEYAELISSGRVITSAQGQSVSLEQGEIIYITILGSDLGFVIRNCPTTSVTPLSPFLFLSSSEYAGMIMSVMLVILLGLYVNSTSNFNSPVIDKAEIQRNAQVVFDKPIAKSIPTETTEPIPVTQLDPKKIKISDETKEQKSKGKGEKSGETLSVAKIAPDVMPIPSKIKRPKKFTSIKKGGAVKTTTQSGANAQSAEKEAASVGLFAAFGGGGTRAQLDVAYSGGGDVVGMAEKASGKSGFSENRPGDDLGSKFKDVGAGGKGVATHGISNIGTKGRAGGFSEYGSENGLGNKTNVTIQPGGADEEFVGTIDKAAIRKVILEKLREIQACYERVLSEQSKGNKLEGRVVMSWEILEKGKVRNAKVKSSELKNKYIENCMKERLASWSFPEPPAGMIAEVSSYPFYFKSKY